MGRGLDWDELFPSRFLKAGELKGRDVTLTISGIALEDLPQDKGGTRVRGILSFNGTKKQLVLNRTNGEAIKALFGRDTGEWIGKRVTFYPAHINMEIAEWAVRVRGSPDISVPVEFELRLPRRKPVPVKLLVTGKATGKAKGKTNDGAPSPEPEFEAEAPAPGEPEKDTNG